MVNRLWNTEKLLLSGGFTLHQYVKIFGSTILSMGGCVTILYCRYLAMDMHIKLSVCSSVRVCCVCVVLGDIKIYLSVLAFGISNEQFVTICQYIVLSTVVLCKD